MSYKYFFIVLIQLNKQNSSMECHVLTASRVKDLERQTKKALQDGWQLKGELSAIEIPTINSSKTVFYQEIKKS
ncbi:protein of unknown function [Paenimyroides ummariense]|uniref:Uncharacterized protein n=2 Tax=Paenimyroides ummariense TaxID=913024 RepID=A0A1I4Z4D8_9FLAO|nr:protein of unknown function [Paenimyroides ummariense]